MKYLNLSEMKEDSDEKKMIDMFDEYISIFSPEESCYITAMEWAKYLAKGIGYYYKNKHYEHECEVRIKSTHPVQDSKVRIYHETRTEEIFNRFYVECPKKIKSEVDNAWAEM